MSRSTYERNIRTQAYEVNRLKAVDVTSKSDLMFYLDHIEKVREKIMYLFDDLQIVLEEEEVAEDRAELTKISKLLDDLDLKARECKGKLLDIESRAQIRQPPRQESIRLPKTELPTFDGQITKWGEFFDLFKAAVHNNTSLTPAQKLTYLKGCLKGSASEPIAALNIQNENYEAALSILKQRFESPKEIVYALLDNLHKFPPVVSASSKNLLKLIDTFRQTICQLKQWNFFYADNNPYLTYLLLQKIDCNTKNQWKLSIATDFNQLPNLSDIFLFLEKAASSPPGPLMPSTSLKKTSITNKPSGSNIVKKSFATTAVPSTPLTSRSGVPYVCLFCKQNHHTGRCHKFLSLLVPERLKFVHEAKACENCLSPSHKATDCPSVSCRHYHRRHHSTLCDKNTTSNLDSKVSAVGSLSMHTNSNFILMPTAIVLVNTISGEWIPARCLLDSGSQGSFMSTALSSRLQLPVRPSVTEVSGIAAQTSYSYGVTDITLRSHINSCNQYKVTVNLLPKLTNNIPSTNIPVSLFNTYQFLKLADPNVHESNSIDLILGIEIWAAILLPRVIQDLGPFTVVDTTLGWVLMGSPNNQTSSLTLTSHVAGLAPNSSSDPALEGLVKQFWDLTPECPSSQVLLSDPCVQHFERTYQRLPSGRFSLALPFKADSPPLGCSRHIALSKFLSLERRFKREPSFKQSYVTFMQEYRQLGHMSIINESASNLTTTACYLSHHGVFKANDPSQKIRVVFNCSSPTSNNLSLNDILLTGPPLQADLRMLLTAFRVHPVAISADLVKFYRCIELNETSRQFLRILWRENESDPLETYTLNTLVFGTKSAPFQALYTIKKLVELEQNNFPSTVTDILQSRLYIDDLLICFPTVNEAATVLKELQVLLGKAGFSLSKWASNSQDLLNELNVQAEQRKDFTPSKHKPELTLGVNWTPSTDIFQFLIEPSHGEILTKRTLLSEIAKIFDPVGFILPLTTTLKIMFQDSWLHGSGWDDPLPSPIQDQWQQFCSEVSILNQLQVPRYAGISTASYFSLLGCSDSSTRAYSAVVYLLSFDAKDNLLKSSLLSAKGRVAPIKSPSLPRLELCAALLLTKLLHSIKTSLSCSIRNIYCLSDSTIVLSWINSCPTLWNVFVANRVSNIQTLLPEAKWSHIPGNDNPADLATRALTVQDFLNSPYWFTGPTITNEQFNLQVPLEPSEEALKEKRKTKTVLTNQAYTSLFPFERFSSWVKLINTIAWMLRFSLHKAHSSSFLQADELVKAERICVSMAQREYYSSEILLLSTNQPLLKSSNLHNLNPFWDISSQLLRVGGRLQQGPFSFDMKHPMILPYHHRISYLYIRYLHWLYFHAGPQLMLSLLRQKFFISRARNLVRKIFKECTVCTRFSPTPFQQIMAPLPASRVTPSRPFLATGLDYAGPFLLTEIIGRRRVPHKGYIALFICMATKAVHLEVVSNLTTSCFLAAFNRFVSRRGLPRDMYSDRGTTFQGANRELRTVLAEIVRVENLSAETLASRKVHWHFLTPYNPHAGGLWERAVQSLKHHLRKVAGKTPLSYEAFNTLLTQCEAILNSRPLTPISDSPDSLTALTPFHFLIGSSTTASPSSDLSHLPVSRLDLWQKVTAYRDIIWKRWVREYAVTLNKRCKWTSKFPNLKIGQIVLVMEPQAPPLTWKLGRVLEIFRGMDNQVRSVRLQTNQGTIERPIVRLAALPTPDSL